MAWMSQWDLHLGVENADWTKKKKKKKKVLRWRVNTHINTALIWDVNVTDVYASKGGV